MVVCNKRWLPGTRILLVCFLITSCNLLSGSNGGTVATPTPTILPGGGVGQPEEPQNPCEGLTGTLEMQLLVGPSEAVGLTPYTFATIPFSVVKEGSVFLVQGNGPVEYYEDILEEEWGTYAVQFEGETMVSGTCVADDVSGTLNVYLQMEGEQMVIVVVEGVEYTYPWVGTPSLTASFPFEDGAQQAGEGWNLILHLD